MSRILAIKRAARAAFPARIRRFAVVAAVAGFAVVGAGAAAVPVAAAPQASLTLSGDQKEEVPEQIQVPEGNTLIAVMPGRGVQTYQCTGGVWTFLQPDAILRFNGQAQVLHTRGPVWTSVIDGSSVGAAVVASAPQPDAIPQLLLQATTHRGPGLLSGVTFIQRLDTTGGVSPTRPCADGETESVPYTADYTFFNAD